MLEHQVRAFLFQYIKDMKIIPQNNNILCKPLAQDSKDDKLIYEHNEVKLYEVISTSVSYKGMLKAGDIVVANSTGTSVDVDGVEHVLFNDENIMAKTVE